MELLQESIREDDGPVKFELLPVCSTVRKACTKLRLGIADKLHQVDVLLVDIDVLQEAREEMVKKAKVVDLEEVSS